MAGGYVRDLLLLTSIDCRETNVHFLEASLVVGKRPGVAGHASFPIAVSDSA